MEPADILERWERDGFVILPGYVETDDLAPALGQLDALYPTADEFHDEADPARYAHLRDEFSGITDFPFVSPELSLLAVHPRMIDLAATLLGTDRLRAYAIETWAKYTGAADYDQPFHRDYLNHSLLVPAPGQPPTQVEMFLYLGDVPAELGPPSYLPLGATAELPALPNWYPPDDGRADAENPTWRSTTGRPDLYAAEVSAAGPAGTVVAYRIETFHRGTALVGPRGARYTIHLNFRTVEADWLQRRAWADAANEAPWHDFVEAATPRQLELFGFPPPGAAYWTDETRAGMALRYPGLDLTPWR